MTRAANIPRVADRLTVHKLEPRAAGRRYVNRTIAVTPEQMDTVVDEPPRYDPTKPQDQELARWIAWSARRKMAEDLDSMTSAAARESAPEG